MDFNGTLVAVSNAYMPSSEDARELRNSIDRVSEYLMQSEDGWRLKPLVPLEMCLAGSEDIILDCCLSVPISITIRKLIEPRKLALDSNSAFTDILEYGGAARAVVAKIAMEKLKPIGGESKVVNDKLTHEVYIIWKPQTVSKITLLIHPAIVSAEIPDSIPIIRLGDELLNLASTHAELVKTQRLLTLWVMTHFCQKSTKFKPKYFHWALLHFYRASFSICKQMDTQELFSYFFHQLPNLLDGIHKFGSPHMVHGKSTLPRLEYDDYKFDILQGIRYHTSELRGLVRRVKVHLAMDISPQVKLKSLFGTGSCGSGWGYDYDVFLTSNRDFKNVINFSRKLYTLEMYLGNDRLESYMVRFTKDKHGHFNEIVIGICLKGESLSLARFSENGPEVEAEPKDIENFESLWGGDRVEIATLAEGTTIHRVKWHEPTSWRVQPLNDIIQDSGSSIPMQVLQRLCDVKLPGFQLIPSYRLVDYPQIDKADLALQKSISDVSRVIMQASIDIVGVSATSSHAYLCSLPKDKLTSKELTLGRSIVIELQAKVIDPQTCPIRIQKLKHLRVIQKYLSEGRGIESSISASQLCLDINANQDMIYRLRIMLESDCKARDDWESRTKHWFINPTLPSCELDWRFKHAQDHVWRFGTQNIIRKMTSQMPTLPGAIRLLKHFARVHKLTIHECNVFWELLMVQVFQTSEIVIATPTRALYRTIHLIASHPWAKKPLSIGIDGEVANRCFTLSRERSFFFIATEIDPYCLLIDEEPTHEEGERIVNLCRKLINRTMAYPDPRTLNIFKPARSDFRIKLCEPDEVLKRANVTKAVEPILAIKNIRKKINHEFINTLENIGLNHQIHLDIGFAFRECFSCMVGVLKSKWKDKAHFMIDAYSFPYPRVIDVTLTVANKHDSVVFERLKKDCRESLGQFFRKLDEKKKKS